MASNKAGMLIVVVMVMMALSGTKAETPPAPDGPGPTAAPAPSPDCLSLLVNMSDCLTFVEAGSNLTNPDKGCCPELAALVDTNPICLCQLLGGPGKFAVEIDLDKALKLPSVCSVTTPPVSMCAAIGIPVGAPRASDNGSFSPTGFPGDLAPEGSTADPTSMNENSSLSIATTRLHLSISLALMILHNFFIS